VATEGLINGVDADLVGWRVGSPQSIFAGGAGMAQNRGCG
jgi:hypothetical protein